MDSRNQADSATQICHTPAFYPHAGCSSLLPSALRPPPQPLRHSAIDSSSHQRKLLPPPVWSFNVSPCCRLSYCVPFIKPGLCQGFRSPSSWGPRPCHMSLLSSLHILHVLEPLWFAGTMSTCTICLLPLCVYHGFLPPPCPPGKHSSVKPFSDLPWSEIVLPLHHLYPPPFSVFPPDSRNGGLC